MCWGRIFSVGLTILRVVLCAVPFVSVGEIITCAPSAFVVEFCVAENFAVRRVQLCLFVVCRKQASQDSTPAIADWCGRALCFHVLFVDGSAKWLLLWMGAVNLYGHGYGKGNSHRLVHICKKAPCHGGSCSSMFWKAF